MPSTLGNGMLGGTLDHWTIGHGVGKRNAKLNDVCPGTHQCMHQWHRSFGQRIASGDIRDERRALLAGSTRERRSNSVWMLGHID